MKANYITQSDTVESGKFTYEHKQRTIAAYGQIHIIPVRNVEFSEKLEQATKNISEQVTTTDSVTAILDGMKLFIGADEVNRIFPKIEEVDVDEVLAFWRALNYELGRNQTELLSKYAPAPAIRNPR